MLVGARMLAGRTRLTDESTARVGSVRSDPEHVINETR
jgi:hypothetical protein